MSHRSALGLLAATVLGFTISPSQAAPRGKTAARPAVASVPNAYPVFTVRYVCFVAEPNQKFSPEEATRRAFIPLPLFQGLQNGSPLAMDTTPEGFANKLRSVQRDHGFQVLLAGSVICLNGSREPTVINDGPSPDAYQLTLKESLFLKQNSPSQVTIRHTGKVDHFNNPWDGADKGGFGWDNMHTDNIVLGRVYSQGIEYLLDGRRVIYAFSVIPAKLDQTASAWTNKAHQTAQATKTNRGTER